jgi:hypothetical protein
VCHFRPQLSGRRRRRRKDDVAWPLRRRTGKLVVLSSPCWRGRTSGLLDRDLK